MRALIFLNMFILFSASGREMTVRDRNLKYSISFDAEKIVYKDEDSELSLQKKNCNEYILARFNKKMDAMTSRPFLNDSRPKFLKIKLDGALVFEPRFGERAVYLLKMRDEIKKLKVEESFSCKKN